jgi:hypothetical protein
MEVMLNTNHDDEANENLLTAVMCIMMLMSKHQNIVDNPAHGEEGHVHDALLVIASIDEP